MATLAQIQAAVDARLATLWGVIQTRQDAYMAAHNGRAWQGLKTHSIAPADGVTALPNVGTITPTDMVGDPWPAAIRNTALEMCLEIHSYDGPQGMGYQGVVTVTVLGQTYTRSAQVGPEAYRASPWRRVTGRVIQ